MADGIRDPEELRTGDGFAYAKRTYGFVPKTIFYDEETANRAYLPPVSPFQDFGVPSLREHFRSIDEDLALEMTLADLVQHGEAWLQERGYVRPLEKPPARSEWIPAWPPMLRLVESDPPWKSVVFEEDRRRMKERAEREECDRRITNACPHCGRMQRDLVYGVAEDPEKADPGYVHADFEVRITVPCKAAHLHGDRGTVVPTVTVA